MTRDLTNVEPRGKAVHIDYLPESTVGSQSYRRGKPLREAIRMPSLAEPAVGEQALHRLISEKAYEFYQRGGQTHGRDLDDWLEAERLVIAELKARSSTDLTIRRRRVRRSSKE